MVVCVCCVPVYGRVVRASGCLARLLLLSGLVFFGVGFLQGATRCILSPRCSRRLVLLGVNFSSVAHGSHKFLLRAQLPSALVAPAKQVEHFVPLAVEL